MHCRLPEPHAKPPLIVCCGTREKERTGGNGINLNWVMRHPRPLILLRSLWLGLGIMIWRNGNGREMGERDEEALNILWDLKRWNAPPVHFFSYWGERNTLQSQIVPSSHFPTRTKRQLYERRQGKQEGKWDYIYDTNQLLPHGAAAERREGGCRTIYFPHATRHSESENSKFYSGGSECGGLSPACLCSWRTFGLRSSNDLIPISLSLS